MTAQSLTRDQLLALRAQLRPLAEGTPSTSELAAYRRFYGLDFSHEYPGIDCRVGRVASRNFSLAVHCWLQSGASANLLLVHGYTDHTGVFAKLVEWGLGRGCNVLIFDLPGHGLSSGELAVIDDFADYSCAIHDVLAAAPLPELPLWVMAQSTGCAALMDFARKYEWPFAGAVFLAPLVRPTNWTLVKSLATLLRPFTASVARQLTRNTSDGAFLEFLKKDPLQPDRMSLRWIKALSRWLTQLQHTDLGVGDLLVVQGDADATVDWRYNVTVTGKLFPGSQVEYLPGAGHQLANESPDNRRRYLSRVEAWLAEHGIVLEKTQG